MFWVIFIEVYVEVGCFKIRINFEKCGGGNCCRYMFISDNIIVYEGWWCGYFGDIGLVWFGGVWVIVYLGCFL